MSSSIEYINFGCYWIIALCPTWVKVFRIILEFNESQPQNPEFRQNMKVYLLFISSKDHEPFKLEIVKVQDFRNLLKFRILEILNFHQSV